MQKSRRDALNFDSEFTKEDPILTPINHEVVRAINQDEFRGFSFVNPDYNVNRPAANWAAGLMGTRQYFSLISPSFYLFICPPRTHVTHANRNNSISFFSPRNKNRFVLSCVHISFVAFNSPIGSNWIRARVSNSKNNKKILRSDLFYLKKLLFTPLERVLDTGHWVEFWDKNRKE